MYYTYGTWYVYYVFSVSACKCSCTIYIFKVLDLDKKNL